MKKTAILLLSILFTGLSYAQSISGNLNAESTSESLGYGNVDVYQNDKLVASVLTDAYGNFNVALDTGTYLCVVNYAGYKPMKKTIHVAADEKADFSVKEDPSKPKRAKNGGSGMIPATEKKEVGDLEEVAVSSKKVMRYSSLRESRGSHADAYGYDAAYSSPPSGVISTDEVGYSYYSVGDPESVSVGKGVKGALTAGEINDYSKWKLWKDLTDNELDTYQKGWKLSIKGRFTVQLQSQAGLPLADAIVDLLRNNKKIFTSRTDNTGKAELWASLTGEDINPRDLSVNINYRGQTKKIRDVKPFEETINHVMMDVSCNEMNNVDIAFVVDATGSMGDELNYLKAEMNDIIYQSKQISNKLNFRFANVFYRDKGSNEAYLTKSMDFNRILSESVLFIEDQHAGGGGDYEEAVEVALDTAINHLSWSDEARTRIVFLILDAPPHNTDLNQKKLQELINKAAQKGIRIVPVGASGINKATEYLMRAMAIGTNGTYTFLTNHSGIGNSHIEPSTDEYKVETLNDIMVRILKSYTYMPDCEQNIPELELEYPDSLVYLSHLDSIQTSDSLLVTDRSDTLDRSDSTDLNWHRNDPNINVNKVNWSYYPNPTNGIINITANIDIAELFITDLSGKLLRTIQNIEKDRVRQVDLSEYTTGIYLIRYPHEDTWISGKVVLHR